MPRGQRRSKRHPNRVSGAIWFKGKQHWVGTFDSKKEFNAASDALRRRLKELGENETMTVNEFLGDPKKKDGWPFNSDRDRREDTVEQYAYQLGPIRAAFGDCLLRGGIKRAQAVAWSKTVSNYTVQIARNMFNEAIDQGYAELGKNPFQSLRKRQSRGRKNIDTLIEPEFEQLVVLPRRLWPNDFGHMMSVLLLTQGLTALRPGETCALRWSAIDFDSHIIKVRRQRSRRGALTRPKSGELTEIIVPPRLAQQLLALPRLHEEFVFTTKTGKQIRQNTLSDYWRTIATAFVASLPDDHWLRLRVAGRDSTKDDPSKFDLYELRHYACTFMLADPPHGLGLTEAIVATQLTHNDGGVRVRKLYGHPDQREHRRKLLEAWKLHEARKQHPGEGLLIIPFPED